MLQTSGNSYSKGSFLMSCCGCFRYLSELLASIFLFNSQLWCYSSMYILNLHINRYVCTESQVYPFPPSSNWTKSVSPTCCQTCHGTVVPDGTVVKTEILDDKCGTVKTSTCKMKNRLANKGKLEKVGENVFHRSSSKNFHSIN